MTPEIDAVSNPDFIAGLTDRPMAELRDMRTRSQAIENSLSYVRRLIQGRLDIVGAELARRHDGGAAGDSRDLISRLPDVLSDGSRSTGSAGSVRPPQPMDPNPAVVDALQTRLDTVIDSESVGNVSGLDGERLSAALRELQAFEDEVSDTRKGLHTTIDVLQAEVTRRYREGEVSVDALLSQG